MTGGRVGGKMRGAPILLLEHVGRKSATKRTNPLIYLDDPPDLVIVASALQFRLMGRRVTYG